MATSQRYVAIAARETRAAAAHNPLYELVRDALGGSDPRETVVRTDT